MLAHLLFHRESYETNKYAIRTQIIFANLVAKKGSKNLSVSDFLISRQVLEGSDPQTAPAVWQ